jgi:hypothetical protein
MGLDPGKEGMIDFPRVQYYVVVARGCMTADNIWGKKLGVCFTKKFTTTTKGHGYQKKKKKKKNKIEIK